MEKEMMLLESMNSFLLDSYTTEELYEKGIIEFNFEWKFNKNVNVFPVLELYHQDKIYKKIESIEFSKKIQFLLNDSQILFNNQTSNPLNLEEIEEILKLFDEEDINCSECDKRDTCFLRRD